MKKIAIIVAILACMILTSCGRYESEYSAFMSSDEIFTVQIKNYKKYDIENPTNSIFTVIEDDERVATIQLIDSELYDMHKKRGISSSTLTELHYNSLDGFAYTSNSRNTEYQTTYIRCYKLTDSTTIYMESLISDEILDEVLSLFVINSKN